MIEHAVAAHLELLARRSGVDGHYGRRLAGDLEEAGLRGVQCEGRATMWRSGEAGGRIRELTLSQLREPMIDEGLIRPERAVRAIELCRDGLSCVSPLVMSAYGRKP